MESLQYDKIDDAPSAIRQYLETRGMAPRKRWGQNFLIDRAARRALVEALEPIAGERVWEIGPGLGAMSAALLERGVKLTLFEIDSGMVHHLRERFGGVQGNAPRLVEGDAVRTIREERERSGTPDRVLGNLPYNAAAPILWELLSAEHEIGRVVCTVQLEVAQRMAAGEGSRDFGPFSVLCSTGYVTRIIRKLPGGCFYPRPRVDSAVVSIESVGRNSEISRRSILDAAELCFTQPRKTLSNNLRAEAGGREEANRLLKGAGIDPGARPGTLKLAQIEALAGALSTLNASQG